MSVATLNTKATGVVLTPEEELTFADIVEAGFTPAPNTSVDLSGFDPVPVTKLVATGTTIPTPPPIWHEQSMTWVGKGAMVEVTYTYPDLADYRAWCEQTEEAFRTQRRMIVEKYLELDYQPLDPLFKRQFVDALRTQGHRQIMGCRRTGNAVCAMGLADEVSHWNLQYVRFSSFAADAIIALNDIAEWTFAKIADWVESKL